MLNAEMVRHTALLLSSLILALTACAAPPPTPALEPTYTPLPRATREALAARPTPTSLPRTTPRPSPTPTPPLATLPITAPVIREDNVDRLAEHYRIEAPLATQLYIATPRALALFGGRTFELRDAETLAVIAHTNLEDESAAPTGWYAIAPDASTAAYLLPNGALSVFDLFAAQRTRTLNVPEPSLDEASDIALADARTLVLVAQRALYRVDLEEGTVRELGIQLPPQTRALHFSKDASLLAALQADGDVLVYRPLRNATPLTLSGFFTRTATAAAFSTNGARFAAADDQTLVIWALEEGARPRVVRTFEDINARVALTFDDEGNYLVINDGRTAFVFDLNADQFVARFRLNAGLGIFSAAFSPDADRLYLVGTDEITAFRLSDGAVLQSAVRQPLMEPYFSPDGGLLLTKGGLYPSAALPIFRAADGALVRIAAHRSPVDQLAFDPSSAFAVVQTTEALSVQALSEQTARALSAPPNAPRRLLCVAERKPFLVMLELERGGGAALTTWDLARDQRASRVALPEDTLAVSTCDNTRNLIAVATQNAVRVLDINGTPVRETRLPALQRVRALSIGNNAAWLAAISQEAIAFIEIESGRLARTVPISETLIGGRFVGRGEHFVFGKRSDTLQLMRVPDGDPIALEHAPGSIVSFSADREGTLLFTASMVPSEETAALPPDERVFVRGEFAVWSLRDGQLLRRIALRAPIWEVAVSPNGRQVALGELNNALSVWQVK